MSKASQGTAVDAAPGTGSTKVHSTSVHLAMLEGSTEDFDTIVGKRVVLAALDENDKEVKGRWTIDGNKDGTLAVKGYDCDWSGPPPPSAAVHKLTDADLASSRIELYWIAPGQQHLSFTTDAAHGELTLSMFVNVHAPALALAQGLTTEVVKYPGIADRTRIFFGFGDHERRRPKKWPGIRFAYIVIAPKRGDGQIAGVQLIWDRTTIVEGLVGITHKSKWKKFWLDSGAPYATPNTVKAGFPTAWAGESYDNGTGDGASCNEHHDTPGRLLQIGWTEYHAHQSFRMFLMYRPDGSGKESIWVTLGIIEWSWEADAVCPHGDNEWDGPTEADWTENPQARRSSELPTWEDAFVREKAGSYWDPPLG